MKKLLLSLLLTVFFSSVSMAATQENLKQEKPTRVITIEQVSHLLDRLDLSIENSSLTPEAKESAKDKITQSRAVLVKAGTEDMKKVFEEIRPILITLKCETLLAKKEQLEAKLVLMQSTISDLESQGKIVEPLVNIHAQMSEKVKSLPTCEN